MMYRVAWVLFALSCIVRIALLGADPRFEDWIGYVTDEGRWVETARNLALFAEPGLYGLAKLHLALSPGFQALNFAVFELAGVNFWSARLSSAMSGIIIVLLVLTSLRKHLRDDALVLGVAILGFQSLMLALSRVAVPEMPSLLFTLLAFLALTVWEKSARNAVFGGLLMAIAISMKATTVLMVPAFLLVCIASSCESARQRARRLAYFLLGLLAPACVAFALAAAGGLFGPGGLAQLGMQLIGFIKIAGIYAMLNRYFDDHGMSPINLLLLGAWLCSWCWIHRRDWWGSRTSDLYVLSGLWAGWWLIVWTALEYSPVRYSVHVVVPLTIHLMAGLTLLGRLGVGRVAAVVATGRSWQRLARTAWLVFPAALVITPVVLGFAAALGLEPDRMRDKLLVIILLTCALGGWAGPRLQQHQVITGFLLYPIILAALWMVGVELGWTRYFWAPATGEQLWGWAFIQLGVAAICFLIVPRSKPAAVRASLYALGIGSLLIVFGSNAATVFVAPTYSIREASQRMDRELAQDHLIWSYEAGSIFLETTLRYRDESPRDNLPDAIVLFKYDALVPSERFLSMKRNFAVVESRALTVHPRYGHFHVNHTDPGRQAQLIVYRRNR